MIMVADKSKSCSMGWQVETQEPMADEAQRQRAGVGALVPAGLAFLFKSSID